MWQEEELKLAHPCFASVSASDPALFLTGVFFPVREITSFERIVVYNSVLELAHSCSKSMIPIATIHAVWQASSSYHFLSQNNCLLSCSASFSPPAHSKWELLRRLHSKSLDSGSFMALIRGDFLPAYVKISGGIETEKKLWGLVFVAAVSLNFKLLGKNIIRESFWDSLMLGKASGDGNKSFYIWRWNHPRRKKKTISLIETR